MKRGLLAIICLACAPPIFAQTESPLLRTFTPGDTQRYRIELTIRSESHGHRAATIAQQTFAEPFSESDTAQISWHVTRTVLSVDAAGVAEIQETLSDFSRPASAAASSLDAALNRSVGAGSSRPPSSSTAEDSLANALAAWPGQPHLALRYRETTSGQLLGLTAQAAPALDDAPAVLTLWLRRALRPTSPLPNRPAREGDRWRQPRSALLPPWAAVQGTETGEWLAASSSEASAASSAKLIALHTVQQIFARVPLSADPQSPASTPGSNASLAGRAALPAPGDARFHAESLSTLVHLGSPLYGGYGALHSATRSASREITHVVEGVPNLTPPPLFRTRLSVQIRITLIE